LIVAGLVMHARHWASPGQGPNQNQRASNSVPDGNGASKTTRKASQPTPQATPPTLQATPPTHIDTPQPAGHDATPQGFRVIETLLRADPFNYTGNCPVTIRFSGRISAIGGSGRVSYKFLRSDGASAPVESVSFEGPSSKDVVTTWSIGRPGFAYSGWESIHILEPQDTQSQQARFSIRCQ
jgi:hypothetical protein